MFYGIKVVLGTPTASPPPWLMAKRTDLFRVGEDGRRLTYGNRREYCPNHPLYHEHITGAKTPAGSVQLAPKDVCVLSPS